MVFVDPQAADPAGIRITYHVHKDPDAEARAAFNRGAALHEQGDAEGARAAYQQAIDSDHPRLASKAARNLGLMLVELGDTQGARAAFQRAVELGHPEVAAKAARSLGLLLVEHGDTQGARAAFEKAVELGHPEATPKAALDLGILLRRQGDQGGAREAFEIAFDSDDREAASKAALSLGHILRDQGDLSRAQVVLQVAVGCEDPLVAAAAAVELGEVFEEHGDRQRAIPAYREAADCSDPQIAAIAAGKLGRLLTKRRPAEAEPLLRRAADAGQASAMTNLATLLIRLSQVGDREHALQLDVDRAIGMRAAAASSRPTHLLEDVCRQVLAAPDPWLVPPTVLQEAEQLYRRAIDAGEPFALNGLGVLLVGCGRLDEAQKYYGRAIDAGVAVAWTNLARLVMQRDPAAASGHGAHAEHVRDLLEHGAQAGDGEAFVLLGAQAVERDDVADAERCLRRAAESGSATGRGLLLILLTGPERAAQTQALVDQIVADDDQDALDTLEIMGVFADAPQLLGALREARSTRDPAAWRRFADLLAAMWNS